MGADRLDDERARGCHLGRGARQARPIGAVRTRHGLWRHRLLRTIRQAERASSLVEVVFSMLFVMILALGAIQVAFFLYARNVLISAAHEGARAAIELGRTPTEAREVAATTVRDAAGGLVSDLGVSAAVSGPEAARYVRVRVSGRIRGIGPLPYSMPVTAAATAELDPAAP